MRETHDTNGGTVSIDERGLTRVHLVAASDRDETTTMTVAETLPAGIDPTTVAVPADAGDWTVYEDGTVHWTTTIEGGDVETATVGVPVTDVEAVDELADTTTQTVHRGQAPSPTDAEPVDHQTLAATSNDERIPEAVYERGRAHDDGDVSDKPAPPTPAAACEAAHDATADRGHD